MYFFLAKKKKKKMKLPLHEKLPLHCNMNSKVQIFGKSKILTAKGRTEAYFRQTSISRHLLSRRIVCEVRLTDECLQMSFYLDFRFYALEGTGPNCFIVFCKILLPLKKVMAKSISIDRQNGRKNSQNKADQVSRLKT